MMNSMISRRRFVASLTAGAAVVSGAFGGGAGEDKGSGTDYAIDRTGVSWGNRPMYLRPYHLTYIVLYYGKREKDWGGESEYKWRALINRMDTEPALVIQVVESFDDPCAGCKYLAKDMLGSVWGVGYTCRSAKKPDMVKDVVEGNRYVLERVGLRGGETILLKDLVPVLKTKIPRLELDIIGSMKSQEHYEKGLADLSAKYGQA